MAGKCKSVECEECPEWIFTFADLVMLMMGFFVILWVTKPAPTKEGAAAAGDPNQEWVKIAASVRESFGYIPDPASHDPVDMQMMMQKVQKFRPLNGPGEQGQAITKRDGAEGVDEKVTSIRDGKLSLIGGRLVFEMGQASLTPEATKSLDQIADKIRGHRNIVLIKGHSSLDDFHDGDTPQERMDLSLRRAQMVANYLITKQVEPDVLRVLGCSNFEPVRQRVYGDSAQVVNRRVEVEATDVTVSEKQGSPTVTPSAPAHDAE